MNRRSFVQSICAISGLSIQCEAEQASTATPQIAIVNQSATKITQDMVDAVQKQLNQHFAPVWGRAASLRLITDGATPAPEEIVCLAMENDEMSGLLGCHSCGTDGKPFLRLYARNIASYGQTISSVLSHECMETLINPTANAFVLVDSGRGTGNLYNLEVCDPVERNYYQINGIEVSNFVTPRFYLNAAPAPYDYLSALTAPLTPAAGGYLPMRQIGGLPSLFGDKSRLVRR